MKTRLILAECSDCAANGQPYKVRMSRATYQRGRPICPIHMVPMLTEADVKAEQAMQAGITAHGAVDICRFLALRGGLKPDPGGELINIAKKIVSRVHLIRFHDIDGIPVPFIREKNQLTISDALELAIEDGYFGEDTYESDLIDAIERTLDGQPFYKPEDFYAMERAA